MVQEQQQGFQVDSFEYRTLPPFRFIGRSMEEGESEKQRTDLFRKLDELSDYQSDFPYDLFFMHHHGLGVDIGPWQAYWGRFMRADTPVPQGFLHFDFIPTHNIEAGPPYISQFAFACFKGDTDRMHQTEGFDSDAMYDVTRNIILGQGVGIPYPTKYWTAEVYFDGHTNPATAYLCSAEF